MLNSGQVALGYFTSVIAKWDIDGVPQPSQAELDVLESEADAAEALDKVHQNRKKEYPSLHEFAEAYTEKEFGGDATKMDAYKIKYEQVRSDNPK